MTKNTANKAPNPESTSTTNKIQSQQSSTQALYETTNFINSTLPNIKEDLS